MENCICGHLRIEHQDEGCAGALEGLPDGTEACECEAFVSADLLPATIGYMGDAKGFYTGLSPENFELIMDAISSLGENYSQYINQMRGRILSAARMLEQRGDARNLDVWALLMDAYNEGQKEKLDTALPDTSGYTKDVVHDVENYTLERAAQVVEGWHIVGAEDSPLTVPHNLWIERVAAKIRELKHTK